MTALPSSSRTANRTLTVQPERAATLPGPVLANAPITSRATTATHTRARKCGSTGREVPASGRCASGRLGCGRYRWDGTGTVETRPHNLMSLFRQNVRFVVPRFQRSYVWTRETNWEPLWDDVLAALESVSDEGAPPHFLGAMVVDQQRARTGTTQVRHVIDGQQRLVTLQLLLAAARDVAVEFAVPDKYRAALTKLTVNDDEMSTDPIEVFKVWPTNVDRQPFRDAMSAGSPAAVEALYPDDRPTIVRAYLFFVDQVRAWAGPMSATGRLDAFDKLVTVFNTGMYAVVIDLDDTDNPQVIFESLNSRGTPLQASDLVRNHLFYLADRQALAAAELYETHWARFDDGHWREDVRQGRLLRPRMDTFLSHFLTMELGKEVPAHQLFVTFRTYLRRSQRPLPEAMARVAHYGDIYRSLDSGHGLDPYEQGFLKRLDALDTTVVMPLLLRLFSNHDAAARRPALQALDSYLLRRMVCGLPTSNYNRLMLDLLRRVDSAGDGPGDVVVTFLAGQTVVSNYWPSDQDVRKAVTTLPIYRQGAKRRLRLLLGLIDQWLRTGLTEYLVWQLDGLTVEHLMPQAWEAHWPLTATDDATRTRQARRRRGLVHTLGNLTLATEQLNQAVANGPWPNKLRALTDSSALNLNRRLPAVWDEDAILARGAMFADVLCQALPRPPATADAVEQPDLTEPPPEVVEADTDAEQADGRSRRPDVADHIRHVLGAQPPGTVLTVSQLASATSPGYPHGANNATVRSRLQDGTVSGVKITTNHLGFLAATLDTSPSQQQDFPSLAMAGHPAASALVARFHMDAVRLHTRGRDEAGHNDRPLLDMLTNLGGLHTAKNILHQPGPTPGFRVLSQQGRPDLTIEALVLNPNYAPMFTEDELATARERLDQPGTP
jgi:Protein of unknown function DUF262/Protein of unknown function (DUF1524)